MNNNTTHRIVAAACVLGMAIAGTTLAGVQDSSPDARKGIVDLTTNYGASGAISSVAGISGAADKVEVTFAQPMHPGNFGMGVNFGKTWTKTWNADKTMLTIGGIDLSGASDPTLIVYLMQKDADRRDISEPNIFRFRDINVTGIEAKNGQVDVDFDIKGKGYGVYLAKTQDTAFKPYGQVTFTSKGVQIKGLENGKTYWFYIEHKTSGWVATRTLPVAITATKN